MEKEKGKKVLKSTKTILITGVAALVLGLVLFLSVSVIPKALVTLTKARSSGKVVLSNSYLLGQKILAKADGEDTCVVNVFLLDKNGMGVAGKTVDLLGMEGIEKVNQVSDSNGKMAFKIISLNEGRFELRAEVDGLELPQTVSVTFRN